MAFLRFLKSKGKWGEGAKKTEQDGHPAADSPQCSGAGLINSDSDVAREELEGPGSFSLTLNMNTGARQENLPQQQSQPDGIFDSIVREMMLAPEPREPAAKERAPPEHQRERVQPIESPGAPPSAPPVQKHGKSKNVKFNRYLKKNPSAVAEMLSKRKLEMDAIIKKVSSDPMSARPLAEALRGQPRGDEDGNSDFESDSSVDDVDFGIPGHENPSRVIEDNTPLGSYCDQLEVVEVQQSRAYLNPHPPPLYLPHPAYAAHKHPLRQQPQPSRFQIQRPWPPQNLQRPQQPYHDAPSISIPPADLPPLSRISPGSSFSTGGPPQPARRSNGAGQDDSDDYEDSDDSDTSNLPLGSRRPAAHPRPPNHSGSPRFNSGPLPYQIPPQRKPYIPPPNQSPLLHPRSIPQQLKPISSQIPSRNVPPQDGSQAYLKGNGYMGQRHNRGPHPS